MMSRPLVNARGLQVRWAWLIIIALIVLTVYSIRTRPSRTDVLSASVTSQQINEQKKNHSDASATAPVKQTDSNQVNNRAPVEIKDLCYSREGQIFIKNMESGLIKLLRRGQEPSFAPTGDAIAYTSVTEDSSSYRSTIEILTLKTNQVVKFKTLNEVISKRPAWSPDATKIAFRVKEGAAWKVGILNVKEGTWHVIPVTSTFIPDLYFSSWGPEGTSVICSDLEYLYEVNFEGKVLLKIHLATVTFNKLISSLTRFSFSQDRRYLLFNSANSPEETAGIFTYDFKERTLSRLTPESIDGSEPHWLPSQEGIIFLMMTREHKDQHYNVATLSKSGTPPLTLINNVSGFSYSTATR